MSGPNLRILVRNLRTKTQVPNEELARLKAIEKAARKMLGQVHYGGFLNKIAMFDPEDIAGLRETLAVKKVKGEA